MSSTQIVILSVIALAAAAAVGSFICVIIDRLPIELDEPDEFGDTFGTRPWREVFGGSSRCSSCGASIRWYQKVPVVSWIALRGRCGSCQAPIPAFHPAVELAVPLLGTWLVLEVGWSWRLVPALWLIPVGIAVAVIDLRTLIVPTRLVWPAFGGSIALSAAVALAETTPRWLFGGMVGLVALALPLAILWFIVPGGMGFGDVRLSVLLGWTVGFTTVSGSWMTAVFTSVAALTCAALVGIVLGLAGGVARGQQAKIPFGPALVIGALVCIAYGADLIGPFDIS